MIRTSSDPADGERDAPHARTSLAVPRTSVQAGVIRILCEALEIALGDVPLDACIRSLPDVESSQISNAILKIQQRFEIEIPGAAAFQVETAAQLVALVEDQLAQRLHRLQPPSKA